MTSSFPTAPKPAAKSSSPASPSTLREKLAAILPQGHKFGIHHVSTPPTRSEPLCAAPLGERPDKTYREHHFLAISICIPSSAALPSKRTSPGADQPKESDAQRKQVLVFAVEVFIFTTAYQTTLFVSKADSTGYLHLLNLPRGTASPIRQVSATFVAYLLHHRRRNHVQSVVNLFARAQAQYLFPGSAHNKGKHVLDDWGLVRWWCKTLNPLLEGLVEEPWGSAKGYLLVPGLEELETRAFIPRTSASTGNWAIGHPLEIISHYTRDFDWVPPRCLIPGYPDDPKSRFRDELDEEVSKRKQGISSWKSVKTLGQFWEMMAFRQECSSGRLTGFIWLVFDHHKEPSLTSPASTAQLTTPDTSFDAPPTTLSATTPAPRQVHISSHAPRSSPLKRAVSPTAVLPLRTKAPKKKQRKKLSGPVVSRSPRIKTHARNYRLDRPTTTAYYFWPPEGRGDKIVDETTYKRVVELLLHLDFSTLDKAVGSSTRWISEVGVGTGWDGQVVGKATVPHSPGANGAVGGAGGNVANLTGLIRRKNPSGSFENATDQRSDLASRALDGPTAKTEKQGVNILGANLVRKKKRDT
ncbi:hypothetical protein MMYC01_207219 [Madurella mycetomatis]|uniref:histone acetyltransferase n=1 Tax=Madurella mycetomatis TaxID=100816 RepID=A0A175VX83_9PEZI|nr:hypothetical protein MMYC01_208793 [Madurella mycetomatis]KXX76137.1 hypothetical protein MMYC01_207219 [Madurella mycetomatis]